MLCFLGSKKVKRMEFVILALFFPSPSKFAVDNQIQLSRDKLLMREKRTKIDSITIINVS